MNRLSNERSDFGISTWLRSQSVSMEVIYYACCYNEVIHVVYFTDIKSNYLSFAVVPKLQRARKDIQINTIQYFI